MGEGGQAHVYNSAPRGPPSDNRHGQRRGDIPVPLRLLRWVFWLFNGGLALMVFASILPQGLLQGYESFKHSYWHARTAEFMHSQWMETLVWIRVPGDIVFAAAFVLLLIFFAKVEFGRRV